MANSVGASFLIMIREDQHVVHPFIPFQIDHARCVSPDYVRDFTDFKFVEPTAVAGRLGDYLVCSHAIIRSWNPSARPPIRLRSAIVTGATSVQTRTSLSH
jgi:hypothetical protein